MFKTAFAATVSASFLLSALPVLAQTPEDAVKARQGFYTMISTEVSTLSDMARGRADYDEAAAVAAAENLMALTGYDLPKLFVDGSSSDELDGTDALPAIWEDKEDFAAKYAALAEATQGLDQAVAGGADNLGPAVQTLGGACRDCHQSYRAE